jgi:endoribonuclease Dicer
MERLELLGDSVLKYAASCHLFLKFPDKDEGELTSSRTDIISNAALYGLGIEHKIQVILSHPGQSLQMLHMLC